MRRAVLILCAGLAAARPQLAGQAGQPVPEANQPIRQDTRLVQIEVSVRDGKGPVPGLSRDAFTLFDRGRAQKIAVFEENTARPPAPRPDLRPGEFTNRAGDAAQQAIVILWDHANTRFEDAATVRLQTLKFLSKVQTQDRIGLYVLDTRLRVIQDFTSDSAALAAAFGRYKEELLPYSVDGLRPLRATGIEQIDELMARLDAHASGNSAAARAERTRAAVRAIGAHLAGVPGRKSVIWIAGEFPGVAGGLAAYGVTVYPVDARGVRPSLVQSSQIERMIAKNSGGVAFLDNDIRAALDQAVRDAASSYTLGFYPDRQPGPINTVKVEAARKGVELAYRRAYRELAERPAETGVRAALESPLDATQISLDVRLLPAGEGSWDLEAELDPTKFTLEENHGRRTGGVEVIVSQRTSDGTERDIKSTRMAFDLDPGQYGKYLRRKHSLHIAVTRTAPDVAQLRLVVVDRVSGRTGSLRIPLK